MAWLSWAALDVDRDERTTFRRAGIAVGDLLGMTPAEVADVTAGDISETRADELCRRASLLELATPQKVAGLERAGVRDRDDLASREPDDLFLAMHLTPYTGRVVHDVASALICAARGEVGDRTRPEWWTAERQRRGFDPMRLAWRHRFGDRREPYPTRRRLRIEAIRVNATIAEAEADANGLPLPPFRHKDVTMQYSVPPERGRAVVGHWQWEAKRSPFFRLEHLEPGAVVEERDGRTARVYEVTDVQRGLAPLSVTVPPGGLLLITPPHLRWAPWVKTWDLPDGVDPELTWLQVAVTAEPLD